MKGLVPEDFPDLEISTLVLETSYNVAENAFLERFHSFKPQGILSFGVCSRAGGAFHLERVALNLNDSGRPDQQGIVRQGKEIIPGGPVGYWSTLPLKKIAGVLEDESIPYLYSSHCGTYLCNHIFYWILHFLKENNFFLPAGFLHIPPFPNQIPTHENSLESSGMDFATLLRGAKRIVELLGEEIREL